MHRSAAPPGWGAFFWLVFNRSSVPMTIVDESRTTVAVNQAMSAFLGRPREELVGRAPELDVTPATRPALMRMLSALQRRGEAVATLDVRRADGTVLHSEFAARATVIDGRRLFLGVLLAGEPVELRPPDCAGALTRRERAVVHLLTLGMTSAEIAERLSISPETVRTHVRNAMGRTGTKTRAQLVACALAEKHISEADASSE